MITYEIKSAFFDRAAVVNAMDKAELRALNQAGALVRRKARQLIGQPAKRKKTKPRPAGSPPRARSNDPVVSLRNILYAYDAAQHTVIVGPVGLRRAGGRPVPQLHEFGGVGGKGQRIPRRPFMNPALVAVAPRIKHLISFK